MRGQGHHPAELEFRTLQLVFACLAAEFKPPRSSQQFPAIVAERVRASKKLRSDELLIASLGSTVLRNHLDSVPLWRGDHVQVKQLVDDFARFLY